MAICKESGVGGSGAGAIRRQRMKVHPAIQVHLPHLEKRRTQKGHQRNGLQASAGSGMRLRLRSEEHTASETALLYARVQSQPTIEFCRTAVYLLPGADKPDPEAQGRNRGRRQGVPDTL